MSFKKLATVLILVFTICISCADDDSQVTTLDVSDIQGNWVVSEINTTPVVDLESNGNSDANLMNQTTCFDGMSLNFDANGNLTVVSPEISFDANETPSFSCELRSDNGSYVISDNVLTITLPISGNQETETIIVDVQNNSLSFSLMQSDISQFFNIPSGESFSAINDIDFVYLKN